MDHVAQAEQVLDRVLVAGSVSLIYGVWVLREIKRGRTRRVVITLPVLVVVVGYMIYTVMSLVL